MDNVKEKIGTYPVSGRLRFFIDHWYKITKNRQVLNMVKNGVKILFKDGILKQGEISSSN